MYSMHPRSRCVALLPLLRWLLEQRLPRGVSRSLPRTTTLKNAVERGPLICEHDRKAHGLTDPLHHNLSGTSVPPSK